MTVLIEVLVSDVAYVILFYSHDYLVKRWDGNEIEAYH